jgi:hypothetical protein
MSANPKPLAIAPLRYSRLKLMAKSPAHVRYALDQDLAGKDNWDDTPSRRLGRLAHAVFLGQPLPTVFPGDRRGKAWTEFKEAHAGEDIVKQEELDTAIAMALELSKHEEAAPLLKGEIERTIFFEIAGRPCRTTPDVHMVRRHVTDLKSTTDASPERFPWQALKLGYHGQIAMQVDGIIAAGMPEPERKAIVAVETKPPYVVNVFALTPDAIEFGRATYRGWFERFRVSEDSNCWPGYIPGVLDAPQERLDFEGPEED